MGRIVPLSELCTINIPLHRRDPNSPKGYIFSKDYVPGLCIGGRVTLTGEDAKNYYDGKPVRYRCPGGCGKIFVSARRPLLNLL